MVIHRKKGKIKKVKEVNYEIQYFKLVNFLEDKYPDIWEEYEEGGKNGKKKNFEEG